MASRRRSDVDGTQPEVNQLLTRRAGEAFDPATSADEVKAVTASTVLCVESQAEIQDALRKNLSRMGYRVLLVGDAERAAERYREAPTDAVIFDFDGLGDGGPRSPCRHAREGRGGRPSRWSPWSCSAPGRPPSGRSCRRTIGSNRALQAHQAQAGSGRHHRTPAGRVSAAIRPSDGADRDAPPRDWCCSPAPRPRPAAADEPGPLHRPEDRALAFLAARFRAGRARTIASPATTTAMPPGPSMPALAWPADRLRQPS